ncbi:hypothetical protein SEA_SATIS_216 [Streptomyces phage Satis]|nr:hypothetical protein SEA_SATIS_216 [Streptomyces phage Satis]QBZ72104.1 hypothetical protein SEA_KRADAL_218 [Streptomyces phage Kradal]QPL14524.1 hypothetical protein SEA_EHYELIMAYOE_219 [Streptomyces phage EhyElimayoE]
MKTTPCPSCGAVRRKGQYLCSGCWDQLRVWVKNALKKKDDLAAQRLRELFDQVHDERPLNEIEVTP